MLMKIMVDSFCVILHFLRMLLKNKERNYTLRRPPSVIFGWVFFVSVEVYNSFTS